MGIPSIRNYLKIPFVARPCEKACWLGRRSEAPEAAFLAAEDAERRGRGRGQRLSQPVAAEMEF